VSPACIPSLYSDYFSNMSSMCHRTYLGGNIVPCSCMTIHSRAMVLGKYRRNHFIVNK